MLTVEDLKKAARQLIPMGNKCCGGFYLEPPVQLRCLKSLSGGTDGGGEIERGEIVRADKVVDENGNRPNCVHLTRGWWWPIENFEIV